MGSRAVSRDGPTAAIEDARSLATENRSSRVFSGASLTNSLDIHGIFCMGDAVVCGGKMVSEIKNGCWQTMYYERARTNVQQHIQIDLVKGHDHKGQRQWNLTEWDTYGATSLNGTLC